MNESVESLEELNNKEKVEVFFDFIHRIFMHHALWFSETRHQLGDEKAYNLLMAWKGRDASAATYRVLYKALSDVKRKDLAQEFCCE